MIAFIVNAYDEPEEEVSILLDALHRHYPLDKILLLEDGGREYPCLGEDFHRRFGRRKVAKWGGFWTHRYLSQALRQFPDADHYIKVDPDTAVIKPASGFPDGEAVFCAVYVHNLGPSGEWRVPHGGALGLTRAMAQRIVEGRLMLDPAFCNSTTYGSFNDIMLADAIKWNRLTLVPREDFACGKTRSIGPDTTFAHTH